MEKVGFTPGAYRCDMWVVTTRLVGVDKKSVDESFKYFCFIILVILMMVLHVPQAFARVARGYTCGNCRSTLSMFI